MKRVPISVVKEFMPWALVGFTLNLLTGMIFIISEPAQYFGNPTWWLKVTFLIIAGANALVFETTYGRRAAALPVGEDTPVPLKDHCGRLADCVGGRAVGRPDAPVSRGRRRGRTVMKLSPRTCFHQGVIRYDASS